MRIFRHAIKKSIALSLIAVTFISALFLPSCGDAHTHEWSEWEVYIEPSCFVAGQEKSECSCGKVKYREIPTSHKYELKEMRIEDRRAVYECSLCGNDEKHRSGCDKHQDKGKQPCALFGF